MNILFKFEMHFLNVRQLTKQQLLNLAQQSFTRRELFFAAQIHALKEYGLFEQDESSEDESESDLSEYDPVLWSISSYRTEKIEKVLTSIVNKANIETVSQTQMFKHILESLNQLKKSERAKQKH